MVAMGRVDPEVAKEHGLIPASRMEMLSELKSLFVNWEPWHQSFFMNHGCNLLAVAGLLPGYAFSKKFRWKEKYSLSKASPGRLQLNLPWCAESSGEMVASSSARDGARDTMWDAPRFLCNPRHLPPGDRLYSLPGDQSHRAASHTGGLPALHLLSCRNSPSRPSDEIQVGSTQRKR